MTERLPELLDVRGVMAECNVKRASAEAIIRHVPKVEIDGLRKVLVRRTDVLRYMADKTRDA